MSESGLRTAGMTAAWVRPQTAVHGRHLAVAAIEFFVAVLGTTVQRIYSQQTAAVMTQAYGTGASGS